MPCKLQNFLLSDFAGIGFFGQSMTRHTKPTAIGLSCARYTHTFSKMHLVLELQAFRIREDIAIDDDSTLGFECHIAVDLI